ncbi:uncharacterized protein LOC141689968 [Apium graveolens]|uniref:uncharacterized protein LOC141689968 n=1 Tax=Apium graveolens TaxID=4045 RepID=UPI003D7B6D19
MPNSSNFRPKPNPQTSLSLHHHSWICRDRENMYSWVRKSLSVPIKMESFSQNKTTHHSIPQENQDIYGVNDDLIHLISSFTLDTFRNYPLQDEEGGANCGDGDVDDDSKALGKVRNDLSEWQQQHAILVLSKAKELSQLRFQLCPRYLKERDFWRIYFTLAKNNLAEYELRAVRLNKLNQMKLETQNLSDTSSYEVEMSETKLATT